MKFAYIIEPPFNDRGPDGAVVGCDVAVARHALSKIGESFEPVQTEFADLLPGLQDGRWRMTTAMFATDARRAIVDFSRSIWALADGLLVRADDPLKLDGYRAVAAHGARLAVLSGQEQAATARACGVASDQISAFETYAAAAEAVRAGAVDAYASVARAHAGYLAKAGGDGLRVATAPAEEKPPAFGAFVFAKGDPLRDAVDAVLAAFIGGAAHRALMARHGFSDAEIDLLV